jgi:hypothetical protein
MELCVLRILMGLAIEMRGYSTDTSAGTDRNSHEECSSPVAERDESGQWTILFMKENIHGN